MNWWLNGKKCILVLDFWWEGTPRVKYSSVFSAVFSCWWSSFFWLWDINPGRGSWWEIVHMLSVGLEKMSLANLNFLQHKSHFEVGPQNWPLFCPTFWLCSSQWAGPVVLWTCESLLFLMQNWTRIGQYNIYLNADPDPVLTRLAKILPVPYNH